MASVRTADASQYYSISQSEEETYLTRKTQKLLIKDEMKFLYMKTQTRGACNKRDGTASIKMAVYTFCCSPLVGVQVQSQASPLGFMMNVVELVGAFLQVVLCFLCHHHSNIAPDPFIYHRHYILLGVDHFVKEHFRKERRKEIATGHMVCCQ